MIITDNERISPVLTEAPLLTGDTDITRKKKKAVPAMAAAIMFIISIAVHLAIITEGVHRLKTEGSGALFSSVVPDYEISEPLVPTLPEGSSVENDGEKDKPSTSEPYIKSSDLSTKAEYGLALSNETSYSPDLFALLGADRPSSTEDETDRQYGKDSPKVLIYHTHATEGYRDSAGTGFRTSDEDKSVISVGKTICLVLEKAGIEAIHVTEQFDRENWSASYDNSTEAVRKIMKKYPSIQYVFDIHRDCIGNETDGYIRATAPLYGRDTAQLMFVCGTDEGGSSHTEWRQNLTFAVQLQSMLCERHEGLMRAVNLRRASFYQDTSPSSLILECGTCAGTLTEAKRAAVLFAVCLADYIKGYDCGLDCEELIKTLCP